MFTIAYNKRYAFLLFSILLLLLLHPLVADLSQGQIAAGIFMSTVFISAACAIIRNRWQVVLVLGIGLPTLVIGWLHRMDIFESWSGLLSSIFSCIFFTYVTLFVLEGVLGEGQDEVTRDRVIGAISGYMLLGLTWASYYTLTETLIPNAFTNVEYLHGNDPDLMDFTYFSFVTLTTLGYGDIAPKSLFARTLVVLEAITGVMYVAILIASFANSFNLGRKKHSGKG